MRTKRIPTSQTMTASVGEKRKRPDGKVFEEPPAIPCTVEELNHVLDKWIRDGVVRPFTVSRPPTEEERKNPYFARSIIMSSIPPRIAGPSEDSSTKS